MTTMEDVFYCHEVKQNDNINAPCPINIGCNTIEKVETEYCVYIDARVSAYKKIKVYRTTQENLRIKRYIIKGEECPICLEGIFHRKDAFLTDCGHCFHFSCFQMSVFTVFKRTGGIPKCAMCRGIVYAPNKNRYPLSKNGLDILEDFWSNIDTMIPEVCISFRKKHWAGMDAKCPYCMNFNRIRGCLPK